MCLVRGKKRFVWNNEREREGKRESKRERERERERAREKNTPFGIPFSSPDPSPICWAVSVPLTVTFHSLSAPL